MPGIPQRSAPPDQRDREAAVRESRRNVLIDAGAGTGKTTTLVRRLIERLAPSDGGPAMKINRIAAVTFTRRAAGELRLRIRERLLAELAALDLPAARRSQLQDALAGLDGAAIGTIHGFADRLLRLHPVEADLSPSYEIAEDTQDLLRETLDALVHGAETGTLADALAGTAAAARAREAEETVTGAFFAGIPAETREEGWKPRRGLDALVAGFVGQRDVPPVDPDEPAFDRRTFATLTDELVARAAGIPAELDAPFCGWARRTSGLLVRMQSEQRPLVVYRHVVRQLAAYPVPFGQRKPRKSVECGGDEAAWALCNALLGDERKKGRVRETPLYDELLAPLFRWMALRLVRLFPVVVALYEKVKARRRVVDQVDLLLKLRDLLAGRRDVRAHLQSLFDHVFVDEFQDTDPLQAEIILYLCEREPRAERWQDVEPADGKLTLVGDPQQSIYRFRRADVAMYDRVRSLVAGRDHLEVRLQANFRSRSSLIRWFNDRFAKILGASPDGRPFAAETGDVYHRPLLPGSEQPTSPQVRVLAFDVPAGGARADEYRRLEAEALAAYVRAVVDARSVQVTDPLTGASRAAGFGDIAVLAIATTSLPLLFPAFDRAGVPYTARGGKLFLRDALHRQFILGLRAVADKDDGVAEAALLRPPFFAIDPADLARERAGGRAEDDAVRRVLSARERVRDLRLRRFERPPGATARDLLEHTAFGRAAALGPNGAQVVLRLRELCLRLEEIAAAANLDYDAATAELRRWVDDPVELDPPHPVGATAVQIMTVHQAKGLEFPVVVLWDGRQLMKPSEGGSAWRMDRDGRGWAMRLEQLEWEEPADVGIAEREAAYALAERKRVVYVAATRARDVLIVPQAGAPDDRTASGLLLLQANPALVEVEECYVAGRGASWSRNIAPPPAPSLEPAGDFERRVRERWAAAAANSGRPRFAPVGVARAAHAAVEDEGEDGAAAPPEKHRPGRFGPKFGDTVHRAIGEVLREPSLSAQEAVRRAARASGLAEHLDEAAADVARAVAVLKREGLWRALGADLRLEYPVAGAGENGTLEAGYIDLIGSSRDRIDLIDFKTDPPPCGGLAASYPAYVAQVRAYGRLLAAAGLAGKPLRAALLFTADGSLHVVGG